MRVLRAAACAVSFASAADVPEREKGEVLAAFAEHKGVVTAGYSE
jgi:hypothetical protein